MFSHVFIGINDFERCFAFYSAILPELGLQLKWVDRDKPWAGWMQPDQPRPLLELTSSIGRSANKAIREAVRGVVAKQRLVPLQAAQRSNVPESPVPGGFASSRALDGVGLVVNSATINCLVRLASPRDEANASPSY